MAKLTYDVPANPVPHKLPVSAAPGTQGRERFANAEPGQTGRYNRIFPGSGAWEPGKGVDAKQWIADLAMGMGETDADEKDAALDNTAIPAGYTYFSQFLTHDLTFDPVSNFEKQIDPAQRWNYRTPRFDLDCLYGKGPADQPYLYRRGPEFGKFLLGKGRRLILGLDDLDIQMDALPATAEDDLPRSPQGLALIGDPRNDQNIIVSQMHLAFLKFHNAIWDAIKKEGKPVGDELFHEAQTQVRYHYETLVVRDLLTRLCGKDRVDRILERALTTPPGEARFDIFPDFVEEPFIPVEFSAGAFRFGHSMVRARYDLNARVKDLPLLADPRKSEGPPMDLRGGRPLPEGWSVDWRLFLDSQGGKPQFSRRIDAKISSALNAIPIPFGKTNSLAWLTLTRGHLMGLPSGQKVAEILKLAPAQILSDKDLGPGGTSGEAPLWYYVLKEAEKEAASGHGNILGPVGGTLVAETVIWLALCNPASVFRQKGWKTRFLKDQDGKALDEFQLKDIFGFIGLLDATGAGNTNPPPPAPGPGSAPVHGAPVTTTVTGPGGGGAG